VTDVGSGANNGRRHVTKRVIWRLSPLVRTARGCSVAPTASIRIHHIPRRCKDWKHSYPSIFQNLRINYTSLYPLDE